MFACVFDLQATFHCLSQMAWECFADDLPLPSCVEIATWTDGDVQCNSLYDDGEELEGAIVAIVGRHRRALFFVCLCFNACVLSSIAAHSLSKAGSCSVNFVCKLDQIVVRAFVLDDGRRFWSNNKLVIYRQQHSTYWWIGPELDGDYVAFV
jgi:hypothetical protein